MAITPGLIPTISPGNLFTRFTTDTSLNIRWLTAADPVFYSVLNRPDVDIAVRQLILAKAIDNLNISLGYQAIFPFRVQPYLISGTEETTVPIRIFWDIHVSLAAKWEWVRLARIKRMSGENPGSGTGDYTGVLRFVFTGQEENSTTELALFEADYAIDSALTYQPSRIWVPSVSEESAKIPAGEEETVDGFLTFHTLDTSSTEAIDFFDWCAPPISSAVGSDGFYITPAVYTIKDSAAGGASDPDDFSLNAFAHGTGMVTDNATNAIPPMDSDFSAWIAASNYPFDLDATLISSSHTNIIIPNGIFVEFDICAPAGDKPTGDVSGTHYPVYISRIIRNDAAADNLTLMFATYNVTDSPSIVPIEFAQLAINRADTTGTIKAIIPITDLWDLGAAWQQGFGRGHVILSSLWSGTSSLIDDFFDSFIPIIDDPAAAIFTDSTSRVSSFGVSRVPKYIPTIGQSQALRGTLSSRTDLGSNAYPTLTNRYVVEDDEGLGKEVDWATDPRLPDPLRSNPDIERLAQEATNIHKMVYMVVNGAGEYHDYTTDILPRLEILFGRALVVGDTWYNGTKFVQFNGSAWQD